MSVSRMFTKAFGQSASSRRNRWPTRFLSILVADENIGHSLLERAAYRLLVLQLFILEVSHS